MARGCGAWSQSYQLCILRETSAWGPGDVKLAIAEVKYPGMCAARRMAMRNTTPRTPSLASIDPALLMMVSGGRRHGCKLVINNNNYAAPPAPTQPAPGQTPPTLPTGTPSASLPPSDPSATGGTGIMGGDQVQVSVSINGQPVKA